MKSIKNRYADLFILLLALSAMVSCSKKQPDPPEPEKPFIIKGADLSFLPEIEDAGIVFYNRNGEAEDMLTTLHNAGMNTVRIRLWHTPENGRSGFNEVQAFAEKVRANGMKVWLTLHYSDSWADPQKQIPPAAWSQADVTALVDSVYNYTRLVVRNIHADYIQIGNEINNGILWPIGNSTNMANLNALLAAGVRAVREEDENCKIMMHIAGHDNAEWLLNSLRSIDYDIAAFSYYPLWNGKDLVALENALKKFQSVYHKEVMIAETAYPFTFNWNDWTNNIIGTEDQILPQYPATEQGQLAFMRELRRISTSADSLTGFCYWGGEWVAFKGTQATNGSSWENMAFYDFNFKALPVIEVFGDE